MSSVIRFDLDSSFTGEPLGVADLPSYDVADFAPHVRARRFDSEHYLPVSNRLDLLSSRRPIPENWLATILAAPATYLEPSANDTRDYPIVLRPVEQSRYRTVAVITRFGSADAEPPTPMKARLMLHQGDARLSRADVLLVEDTFVVSVVRLTGAFQSPLSMHVSFESTLHRCWAVSVTQAVFTC